MTKDLNVEWQLPAVMQGRHISAASGALFQQSWGAGHMLGTSTP